MTDQPQPLSAAEVAEIAEYHRPWAISPDECHCGDKVPCDAERLLATLAARDASIAALEGLIQEYCAAKDANDIHSGYDSAIEGRYWAAERALWVEAEQLEARDGG